MRMANLLLTAALVLGLGDRCFCEEKGAEPAWVVAMKKVRARFTGKPGTLALFGDSITISMAFWAPLRGEAKGMSAYAAADHTLVKKYLQPACWAEWRGPKYGNNGRMTIRWAHANIDRWLRDLNPEAAVIMFGSNDLFQLKVDEFEKKTAEVVERCLKNGTVVLLTTLPPAAGRLAQSKEFAEAVRRVAKATKVSLIDYQAEILRRRPDDWNGMLPQFKGTKDVYQVPTLISGDGIHPSNPRDFQDHSEKSLNRNGFLLRNHLTMRGYAEVIRRVLGTEKKQ